MVAAHFTGIHAGTGKQLQGDAHLLQSVRDILTTPLGSRVARRDYGSAVPFLLDHPINQLTTLRIQSAAVSALLRWEPRVRPERIAFEYDGDGRLVATAHVRRVADGRALTLNVQLTGVA